MDRRFAADLKVSRFAGKPLVLYKKVDGETLFGLQVQPKLSAPPDRPRDYLVLVDTSASKAGGVLTTAHKIVSGLVDKLRDKDRLALWTININTRNLSEGFRAGADLKPALDKLAKEFPAGAVDLKKGLALATAAFAGRPGRDRVMVFFGDGKSVAGPVDADARADLADRMVQQRVAFYSVPLGLRMDAANLHGFPTATGGKVVRFDAKAGLKSFLAELNKAVSEPILYPNKFTLSRQVTEHFPTALPPLRRDVPTLVVGKIKPQKGRALEYEVAGTVSGRPMLVETSHKVPEPDEDNFFLVNVTGQWQRRKDRPALVRADRALAFAFEKNRLARADLLAKAGWAVEATHFDEALRLYNAALRLDPHSVEAKGGKLVVAKLRKKVPVELLKKKDPTSKEKLRQLVRKMLAEELEFEKGDQLVRLNGGGKRLLVARADPAALPGGPPGAAPEKAPDPLADVKARQAIADQQANELVNEAIRRANRLVREDPDVALQFLKRTQEGIRDNFDLSPRVRTALVDRLTRALASVDREGRVVIRAKQEAEQLQAIADARRDLSRQRARVQNNIRERLRVFHDLMNQAREREAYQQAQDIAADLVKRGLPIPPAVAGAYGIGLRSYHVAENRELRRIREERWLAVLLQVEKSHIPFPDEPPVEFPPAPTWRALTDLRRKRYESSTFGAEIPAAAFKLRDALASTVKFGGFEDPKTTLVEALDQLSRRYDVTFDVNEKAFQVDQVMDVLKTEIANPNPIPPMNTSLATVLKKVLARVPAPSGATYLIRRDVIEITTGQFAVAEKAVRVYPVADLVIPIPNSINQQVAQQSLSILGSNLGLALGGGIQLGGGFQLGLALGGGLQLGGIQLGGGLQLGGIQLGGGLQLGGIQLGGIQLGGQVGIQLGLQVGNQLGAQLGQIGQGFQGNFQGAVNLGVGGGIVGQQLGQFGNLGGQFGLQGGDQSQLLITLITQVVGKPQDWAIRYDPVTGQPINPVDDPAIDGIEGENNNLGYYPPALALVVKAPSKIHNRESTVVVAGADPGGLPPLGGMGALPKPRKGDRVAVGKKPRIRVGGAGDDRGDDKKKPPLDPKKVWQDALVKARQEPGMIIATTDFLALNGKWNHAAEFLKANLRLGLVREPWVYKALAMALRESGGSPEEIERAEVSAADLAADDSRAYLDAARGMARDKHYGRALAFCRQAALLEPNVPHPYALALNYAELAKDSEAMSWAASHLLRQDWPFENKELQSRARQKVDALAATLKKEGKEGSVQGLLKAVKASTRRDLVVRLVWQGEADLDLEVSEPTESTCTILHRQTVGGGTLIGDSLLDSARETYVAPEAFSGEYHIVVRKVWGRTLGNKAQLHVIRHQGTEDQREQLFTVELSSQQSEPITIHLKNGRRQEMAYVPPPEALESPNPKSDDDYRPDKILTKLRALADPEVTGVQRGIQGRTGAPGRPAARKVSTRLAERKKGEQLLRRTRVAPFTQNQESGGLNLTAQAVLSADRRYVRVSVSPVFTALSRIRKVSGPSVVSPVFPGMRGK